jgi:hypothetical protein
MEFDASEFQRRLKEAGQRAIDKALQSTDVFGEHVLGDAQQLAPVGGGSHSPYDPAPGTLQASGTTTPAVVEGDEIKKEIGFNAEHAAVQHENLEYGHDVGQAKFLEAALRQNAPKFGEFVSNQLKEIL